MKKEPDYDYDKRNISMVNFDTDIQFQLTRSWWRL